MSPCVKLWGASGLLPVLERWRVMVCYLKLGRGQDRWSGSDEGYFSTCSIANSNGVISTGEKMRDDPWNPLWVWSMEMNGIIVIVILFFFFCLDDCSLKTACYIIFYKESVLVHICAYSRWQWIALLQKCELSGLTKFCVLLLQPLRQHPCCASGVVSIEVNEALSFVFPWATTVLYQNRLWSGWTVSEIPSFQGSGGVFVFFLNSHPLARCMDITPRFGTGINTFSGTKRRCDKLVNFFLNPQTPQWWESS